MSYSLVRFKRWHLMWLEEKGYASGGAVPMLSNEVFGLMEQGFSWTAVYNGEPIGCGGLMKQWPDRYTCWAFLNPESAPHMVWITRQTRKKLDEVIGRIEMTVRQDFKPGHRWAKLLGFVVENPPGILKGYGPEGEDHIAYVRFNG